MLAKFLTETAPSHCLSSSDCRRYAPPSMSLKSSADKGLINLDVQMVPDVQTVQAGYESNWSQSFKKLQSFENRTLMTGDFRVQTDRDRLCWFIDIRGRLRRATGAARADCWARIGIAKPSLRR